MRRSGGRGAALPALALAAVWLAAGAGAGAGAGAEDEPVFVVAAVGWEEGGWSGAALAAAARATLAARGAAARVAAAPAECAAPDAAGCLPAVLGALARGALHAALVPAPRAPPPPQLRDAGLEELADAAPAQRRACYATPPDAGAAPRSLLDFSQPALAARYALSRDDIETALRSLSSNASVEFYCGAATSESTDDCSAEEESSYATTLTGAPSEAALVRRLAREHGLRLRGAAVPPELAPRLPGALAPRAALLCARVPPRAGAAPLGPPPCRAADCPFEPRRLLKLVNVRELARAPTAVRALGRLALDGGELRALAAAARAAGPAAAAAAAAAAHPEWAGAAAEVRVAVMVPVSTRRRAYDAAALRAAAELAEIDERAAGDGAFRFKVETLDDACSGSRAFKHLTDALGAEFGALSAVAGPACGGAFGDVMRQSGALRLPVLAYTAQAAPAGARGPALLAAGSAHAAAGALGALLAHMRWRRLALLSEAGARPDAAVLAADVVVHVELPDAGDRLDAGLILQWAARAAAADARILYVCAEDARVVRAALCAGARAGLLPAAGAVWLLPDLPAAALRPAPGDPLPCAPALLHAAADGHLSLAPAWAARWESDAGAAAAAWRARVRARCPACAAPPAHAALLYDTLRLWAAALRRLARERPADLDDLHRDRVIGSLVRSAVETPYEGLTGRFEWEATAEGAARLDALVLRQWSGGRAAAAGEWRRGALALRPGAPAWRTPDGRAPDDGGERCALRALAEALGADCRVAYGVAGALPLAALAALAAGAAARWRRRAERERRARLAALGGRAPPKPAGLDRWEVPRERVVIDRKLGTGAFGTVYGGHALLAEGRGWTAVAVKTLRAGATADEKLDFLSEAEAMKRFDHENVVRLLGVVTETEPVCTVMEFMLYGDLKSYLVARRQLAGAGAAGAEVAPARLTALARDAARALAYLARRRYVHRDVAARNCLVSAARGLKLADFGMARLVHEHDYYRFSRKGLLPVRWMAPESLALGVFSPASDVWSFGVLLYEIVTFGALPFQGLSNAEVLARVKAGAALALPAAVRPPLESLIVSCWRRERAARPTAAALARALADCPRLLAPCVDAPLDALPLALEPAAAAAAAAASRAETRWVSWTAPTSAATTCTDLSAEGAAPPDPTETDAFLPPPDA